MESTWIRLFQISLAKLDLNPLWTVKRWVALSLAGILLVTGAAQAAVVTVVSSGGFAVAYRALECSVEIALPN